MGLPGWRKRKLRKVLSEIEQELAHNESLLDEALRLGRYPPDFHLQTSAYERHTAFLDEAHARGEF